MAEDDVPGLDMDMDDDDYNWLYVEEDYPLADELAETQISDPGYSGTNYEIEMEMYDFDAYEYFDDLEYGTDVYWDGTGAAPKRKRMVAIVQTDRKRRKVMSLKDTEGDGVRFMTDQQRDWMTARKERRADGKNRTCFALLPDWRERLADEDDILVAKTMPPDMKKAAEGHDDSTPTKQQDVLAVHMEEEGDGMGEEDGEDAGDLQIELSSLDPNMLKAILKDKLGSAGLDEMDEAAFMQTIGKMLTGDEGADAAAGELAESLLGQATEGENAAFSNWLAQQGVALDAAEDGDETLSITTAEVSDPGSMKVLQVSPPDSAIEVLPRPAESRTADDHETEKALRCSSKPLSGAEKRGVSPSHETTTTSARKRARKDKSQALCSSLDPEQLTSDPVRIAEGARSTARLVTKSLASNDGLASPMGRLDQQIKSAEAGVASEARFFVEFTDARTARKRKAEVEQSPEVVDDEGNQFEVYGEDGDSPAQAYRTKSASDQIRPKKTKFLHVREQTPPAVKHTRTTRATAAAADAHR